MKKTKYLAISSVVALTLWTVACEKKNRTLGRDNTAPTLPGNPGTEGKTTDLPRADRTLFTECAGIKMADMFASQNLLKFTLSGQNLQHKMIAALDVNNMSEVRKKNPKLAEEIDSRVKGLENLYRTNNESLKAEKYFAYEGLVQSLFGGKSSLITVEEIKAITPLEDKDIPQFVGELQKAKHLAAITEGLAATDEKIKADAQTKLNDVIKRSIQIAKETIVARLKLATELIESIEKNLIKEKAALVSAKTSAETLFANLQIQACTQIILEGKEKTEISDVADKILILRNKIESEIVKIK